MRLNALPMIGEDMFGQGGGSAVKQLYTHTWLPEGVLVDNIDEVLHSTGKID